MIIEHINFDENIAPVIFRRADDTISIITRHKPDAIGWNNLTPYQRTTLVECFTDLVDFLSENSELLTMPLASYSINGVNMQFKFNPSVYSSGGLVMPRTVYDRLLSTGLCYGGML